MSREKYPCPGQSHLKLLLARLQPEAFQACFLNWVRAIFETKRGQAISVDGKSARRSHDQARGKEALQTVSAWAEAHHVVLAQRKVGEGQNEIPAIAELLELSGCIVTIDVIGCQTEIARQIVNKDGDFWVVSFRCEPHASQALR